MPEKKLTKKSTEEEVKKELKYRRDRDNKKVKGVFRFNECEGGTLSFVYRAYKEDEVERYDLVDGQIYELPLGVARHLNTNVWYPQHAYLMDENGKPQIQVNKKIQRASFQSLEFMDIEKDQQNADIVIAKKV